VVIPSPFVKNPRRPRDPFALAVQIGQEATGQRPKPTAPQPSTMAERGARGGRKGGKARAKALSADRRAAIARKAAKARWATRRGG
jgi:hypothetical protein